MTSLSIAYQRIASVASLHRTILELQSAAVKDLNARALTTAGYATPSTTPPSHTPPLPHQHAVQHQNQPHHGHGQHQYSDSRRASMATAYGPGGSPPTRHEPYPTAIASSSSSSYPTLPPIASMGSMAYGEPPRKRARAAASPPPSTRSGAGGASRASPEYPLSPYSMDSSSTNNNNNNTHSSRRSNGYANAPPSSQQQQQWPIAPAGYANSGHGRVSVNSLLSARSEDGGDVRYRRMSAERSSR